MIGLPPPLISCTSLSNSENYRRYNTAIEKRAAKYDWIINNSATENGKMDKINVLSYSQVQDGWHCQNWNFNLISQRPLTNSNQKLGARLKLKHWHFAHPPLIFTVSIFEPGRFCSSLVSKESNRPPWNVKHRFGALMIGLCPPNLVSVALPALRAMRYNTALENGPGKLTKLSITQPRIARLCWNRRWCIADFVIKARTTSATSGGLKLQCVAIATFSSYY